MRSLHALNSFFSRCHLLKLRLKSMEPDTRNHRSVSLK